MGLASGAVGFDACVLINLLASGRAGEIIRVSGSPAYICTAVHEEISYLRGVTQFGGIGEAPSDDLTKAELLIIAEIASEKENTLYVEYSRRLGTGEAMTLAMVQSRGWAIATDDRKAIKIATAALVSPPLAVLTTPEILRNWVQVNAPPLAEAGLAIRRIENIGRFRPAASHPLCGWWDSTKANAP